MTQRRIGELLIAEGLVSETALARALEFQRSAGRTLTLGGIFLNWGLLGEEALLEALAKLYGCPAVPWGSLSCASPAAVHLLSGEQAIRIGAMPYATDKKTVHVAFANPSNLAAVDEVAAITKRRVVPAVTTEVRLLQAHQRFYARPIPIPVWTILQKLDRKPQKPPDPVVQILSQAPETSGTPPETILALAGPGLEGLGAAQPLQESLLEAQTPVEAETPARLSTDRVDPYSDQYSLTDFVAEALTVFGGLPESGHTGQAPPHEETVTPRTEKATPPARLNPEATLPSRYGYRGAARPGSSDSTRLG